MGNDNFCGYGGRRDEVLVSYLYGEIDAEARAGFERHLTTCVRCRAELHGLRGVREELGRWTGPEAASPRGLIAESPQPALRPTRGIGTALRELPAWMHVAAAMLFLGAAAGLANIRVASTVDGFTVRTGWSRAAEDAVAGASPTSRVASAPWRADLVALEQQFRTALAVVESPAAKAVNDAARSGGRALDDEVTTRRVNALIQASERRQQRELALRVAELMRDV
jgi:anti-sigma factor RsiW